MQGDTLAVSTSRPDDTITAQTWLALVAMGLGVFVIANDFTALSAATLRHGITIAFRVDAALALAGFAVALGFVRGPRTSPAHAAVPAAHHRVRA